MSKEKAQRSRWTFYEAVNIEYEIEPQLSTTLNFKYYETPLNVKNNQVNCLKLGIKNCHYFKT